MRGNGTITGYAYDPVSRLAHLGQDLGGTGHDVALTFSYNPASQIHSNTRSNDAYSWTGHGSGTTGSTANGLNQLVNRGGVALSHDGKGNITFDGARTFGYTAENLLAVANGGQDLAYDGFGRLDWVNEPVSFGYDGEAITEELHYVGGHPIARRYVHGPGVDEPLVWYEGSGTSDRRFLHADERGSIVAVSDNAGNAITINRYDEYGKPAATNIGRFQYTGQAWLPEIGLYYYKARMYNPDLQRFMQTDRLGYYDGPNLYAYVRNDPVNLVDPTGLASCQVAKAKAAAESGGNHAVVCGGTSGGGSQGNGAALMGGSSGNNGGMGSGLGGGGGASGGQGDPCEGSSDPNCNMVANGERLQKESFQLAGFNRKGERKRAAKPGGTDNPYKKIRAHPSRPGWVKYQDQNGKTKERPGTPDELSHLAAKGGTLKDGARMLIPFGLGVGLCALAPSTCGLVDVDGNGTLDFDDWENY